MTDATMPKLNIEGRVGYPIWTMADGPDSAPIGLRLDCGDAGVVYMTAEQARAIAQDLVAIADELEKPACSPQESTCSGVESAGEPHPEDTCQRCAGPNITWFTDNPTWNAVMRDDPARDRYSIVCPICFCRLAQERGIGPVFQLGADGGPQLGAAERDGIRRGLEDVAAGRVRPLDAIENDLSGDALRDARFHQYLQELEATNPENADQLLHVAVFAHGLARSRSASLEAQLAEAKLVRNDADRARMREAANVLKLLARNGKLVEALTRYGKHDFQCCRNNWITRANDGCTCGFTEALGEK